MPKPRNASPINRALRVALGATALAIAALYPAAAATAEAGSPWLLAGPFPAQGLTGLEDSLDRDYLAATGVTPAGEAEAAPLRIGGPGAKLWREAPPTDNGGPDGVDLAAALGQASYSVAYAYREIYAASPREAVLRVRSDDGVKIWLNGGIVLARHTRRSLEAEEDAVVVDLVKGPNRMLVKVSQAEGAWGFRLRLLPLEEEARAAASAKLSGIAAYPDELAVPRGGTIRGTVMTKSAFCVRGRARVELVGPSGDVLAATEAPVGGRFSLTAPESREGPARLRARGSGGLAGLASPASSLIIGDAASIAHRAAATARRAAAANPLPDICADPASALEFLAEGLEGARKPEPGGFDAALLSLATIESASRGYAAREPRGLARFAYRSSLDRSLQPYTLYLPPGYDGKRRYGLVVALHGASGNDYDTAALLAAAEPEDMLILAPYGRGDLGYEAAGERDVEDVLDLVMARYAIDADRVYLAGMSMGGFGAWRLAKLYSWRFAAVASFAGWTGLDMLENLASTPVLAVHGDADKTVPPEPDRRAVEYLASIGGSARFDLLPGVDHDAFGAWTSKDGPGRLFSWLRAHRREAWPKEIKVRTTMARAGKGKWASILGVETAQTTAAIDAKIVDPRHVEVDTENVSAFELDLRHPELARGGRILVLADGVNLTADSGSADARFEIGADGRFAAAGKAGRPEASKDGSTEAAPNGGAGFVGLFDGPLRIVYGTKRKSGAAGNEAVARALSGSGIGDFEVLPDTALGPADGESSALLLVGGPDENSATARLAPNLPLAMKGGKVAAPDDGISGSGLLLVCPNPDARERLLGVMILPMRGDAAARYARAIVAPLRDYGIVQEACGYGTPDAILLDRSGEPIWMGFYDWRWERLRGSAPAKH